MPRKKRKPANLPKTKPLIFPGYKETDTEAAYRDPTLKERSGSAAAAVDPPLGGWDSNYVPGYSDTRHMNDLLEKDGKKKLPLAARLQWVRYGGENTRRDLLPWKRQGYEFINERQLKDLGYGFPPAAHNDAEGHIRKDDVVLMFCLPEQAQRNLEAWEKFHADVTKSGPAADTITSKDESREKVYLDHSSEAFD